MKQTKVLTGIAVAALSTGTGLVQADDLSNTRPAKAAEVVTHTEVTENQVADAKTKADEATKAVKDQEATVKAIEAEKSQAQQSLVEATTAVNDTEKLASEATPDGLTKAQEETEASQSAVTDAQAQLEAAQEAESKAQTAVDHQKETVAKASQAVNQAKAALTTSNQAADVSAAEEKVLEAQEAVTKAETQVSQAQEADAKHESDVRHAKEELDLKSQKLTEKQTTLEQVMAAIEAERLTKPVENGTYFNQRDNEWQKAYGGKTFAATGCVPSALAMVFSELAKREVTPTEIADYLWHNTDEFNKHYGGTSGKGLVAATNHYGFASTHLDSQSTIIAALQAGHHVLAAVQNNKFSPWGSQYSHEIVLRGYSNGNTYVYDPYNRANIGWYPIANLWNEQSRDAIDTAEVGVPFFKITTQKMAQLEMAKAVANEGLDEAKQAVKQAEANMLDKAKQTAKLTEQDLETKTANLKQAQEHLTLKQDDLAKAQTELAAQEKSLEQLTQVLSLAQENLGRATKAVEQTKADLTQKQAYVTNLKQVTKLRQESQAKVNQAKAVLSEASARLEQELETLKTLQAKEANLTAQYQAIFKAYQAVLAVKHHSQLAESKAKLEAKGEEAVPVVNEVGHVTDYVSGPTQLADAVAVRTEETSSKTKNTSPVSVKLMAKQGHQKALETIVTSQSSLPQTGEQVVSILSLVGLNFLGLSSFLGLRKQEEK
ncbi:C39 family peptidase [Streptococcus pyogenes]|uniref:C39 family peptidase n=1 Tax=Streptococcus pyogenes TaxID=1314 RepID=UPI0039A5A96C